MTEATGIVGEFLGLKEETAADVLAMQCGDFYEFFADDAELVADELDLKVSQKSSHGSSYPMAGVPVDDLTPYLKALVERGYTVAVAEQHEDGGDIHREIERMVTPGTLLDVAGVDAQYLAAVVRADEGDDATYGLAFADVTTGRFHVTTVDGTDAALTELYRFSPVEVLPGPDVRNDGDLCDRIEERTGARLSLPDADSFAPGKASHVARDQFGDDTFATLGVGDLGVRAAGAVLAYVDETGTGVLASMTRVQPYHGGEHVELDATTQRNLELTETMHGDRAGSLFATVDHTVTSPGGRLLKEWLQRPRRDRGTLEERQASVAAFAAGALGREEIREVLDSAYDLERLAAKAVGESADATDLLRVRDTLGVLPELVEAVEASSQLADSPLPDILSRPDRAAAANLREELADALVEDPPKTTTQGGLFQRGYDDELDELRERHEAAQAYFDELADRVKREHGLSHVTVDRNKTDGYYVQVGKSAADGVPEHFEHVKTLKNSKRFRTEELAEKERELFRLEEQRGELEARLFDELRERVAARAELLQDVGRTVAEVDVLASLATHAVSNDWTRPELTEGRGLDVTAGRHPVVEQTVEFVPNDCHMDDERTFTVVTGPNMSGKSTYMRQTALIVLLAQVGSFVPAREATVGLVDGIYTRVGALDELAQGRSTFMVEMQELSNILHSATEDSLVILDEVGRGTATYDGISIAWAAVEYLHNEIRAKTLFATHYHELTGLAEHLDRVQNVHVAADERDGDVTFLRTVREGPTDRSYGIHVADLAGVPGPVVDRARDVLDRLRQEKAIEARGSGGGDGDGTRQVVFDLDSGTMTTADGGREPEPAIDPETAAILDELDDIDVDRTSPVELMQRVQEWQERLQRE
ncbi:DNA mismatch repair protein MutS [Haloarchaeobius salinus]|uniref:DNA mismatch repair protein MutS n=1 Tax=Haloarchaeobius salinus TaxID=1198298 RepID=UPI002109404E|nr:DNA mismatch repair protein MutS [Haloarchaeobius salinus]